MAKPITKAMILAAGKGTRLLPITNTLPKPLVPVLNIPNILHTISILTRAGIKDIIINTYHLGDLLSKHLGSGERWGIHLTYSDEDVLLGTGGGVKRAEWFLEGQPFVLCNSDFITNIDVKPAIEFHQTRKNLATMILIEDPMLQSFYSSVGTDVREHICSLPGSELATPVRTGIFTGIHILEPESLDLLDAKPSGITQTLYKSALQQNPDRVGGYFASDSAYWMDTGELYFMWMTSLRLLERLEKGDSELRGILNQFGGLRETRPLIWSHPEEELPQNVELIPPLIVDRQCHFVPHCKVGPYGVIGAGASITQSLSRFIALPGSRLPPQADVGEGVLLYSDSVLSTKKSPASN